MKKLFFILILVFGTSTIARADHVHEFPDRDINRLYEIFAWRYADALSLPPEDEEELKDIVKRCMKLKYEVIQKKNHLLTQLIKNRRSNKKLDDPKAQRLLSEYEALLAEIEKHDHMELEDIKKLLSPNDVLRYLALKRELSELLIKHQ